MGDAVGLSIGMEVVGAVGLNLGAAVGLAVGGAVGLAVGGAVGLSLGLKVGGSIGLNVGGAVGLSVGGALGLTVRFDLGRGAGAVVGGAIIRKGVGVGPTPPPVTVAPIVEPACCTVYMTANSPSPSKALDSSCSRSSPGTDVPSYSTVTVIMYLKVSSLLIVLLRREVTAPPTLEVLLA